MFLRKLLPLALAAALVLFAGCNEEPAYHRAVPASPGKHGFCRSFSDDKAGRVERAEPGHALPLEEGERGCQTYAFSHGKAGCIPLIIPIHP